MSRPAGAVAAALWLLLGGIVSAQPIELHGAGTTNPSKFIWKVMDAMMEQSKAPVILTYRSVGSGTGIQEFVGDAPDRTPLNGFGSGDIPLDLDKYNALSDAGASVLHVPFLMGAVSFFHNVPGAGSGETELKLTACLLARIFSGDITKWDHEDIVAANPWVPTRLPAGQPITVLHRNKGSSSTKGITSYLDATCPDSWGLGADSVVEWPASDKVVGVDGSGQMVLNLSAVEYSIGYVDAGHGHRSGLKEVSLANSDGIFLTSEEASITDAYGGAGTLPADFTDSFDAVSLLNQPGESTWPIVQISYFYVRPDQSGAGDAGALLKAFLKYVLNEGQEFVSEFAFEPLPAALQQLTLAQIDEHVTLADDQSEWIVETAASVRAGEGSRGRVFSGRRQRYASFEQAEIAETVAGLSDQVGSSLPVQLHGSGTTNPSKYLWQVMHELAQQAALPLTMTYRAVGSTTGQVEFVGADNGFEPLNDFGCGDLPLSTERYEALADAGRGVLQLPFLVGGVGVFYNLPGLTAPLKLSACVVARIFQRDIKQWDHEDISGLNPGVTLPAQNILVHHRTLGSSSTDALTTYLAQAATCGGGSSVWKLESGALVSDWPDDTVAVSGSSKMAAALQNDAYSIGYVDAGHGHGLGLQEAALTNAAGASLTSKDADIGAAAREALEEGVLPTSAAADWSDVSLINLGGQSTWPITQFSYFYVRDDLSAMGQSGALLKALLQYVLSEEGQGLTETYRFARLPDEVAQYSREALAGLGLAAGAQQWSFEGDDTLPSMGAGRFVFSRKRQSHADRVTEELRDSLSALSVDTGLETEGDPAGGGSMQAGDLTARVLQLEERLAALEANRGYDSASNRAIAALVLSCLALLGVILLALASLRHRSSGRGRKDAKQLVQMSTSEAYI